MHKSEWGVCNLFFFFNFPRFFVFMSVCQRSIPIQVRPVGVRYRRWELRLLASFLETPLPAGNSVLSVG